MTLSRAPIVFLSLLSAPALAGTPKLEVQTGHAQSINEVVFSPKGDLVATAGSDYAVRFWDPETGKELRALRGASYSIEGIAFSPDGRFLAAVGAGAQPLLVFDLSKDEKPLSIGGFEGGSTDVAFDPKGKLIAVGSTYEPLIRIFDARSGKLVKKLELKNFESNSPAIRVVFSADGSTLYAAADGDDMIVQAFSVATGRPLARYTDAERACYTLALVEGGRQLAIGSRFDTVVVDARTMKLVRAVPGTLLAVSADRKQAVFNPAEEADTLEVREGRFDTAKRVVARKKGSLESAALRPDSTMLAYVFHREPRAILADVKGEREPVTLGGHGGHVRNLVFGPKGRWLATTTGQEFVMPPDYALKIWGNGGGVLPRAELPKKSWGLGLLEGGRRMLVVTDWGPALLFEQESLKEVARLEDADKKYVGSAVSPDGTRFALGRHYASEYSEVADLIEVRRADGQVERRIPGLGSAWALALAPDGKSLLARTGHKSGDEHLQIVRLVSLETGADVRRIEQRSRAIGSDSHAVGFSADGTLYGYTWQKTGEVHDVATGELRHSLGNNVSFVGFAPRGHVAAGFTADGELAKLVIDDVDRKQRVLERSFVSFSMPEIAWSPDGRLLALALDTTVELFDLEKKAVVLTLVPIDEEQWVAVAPDGRFDGSPDAFKHLRWVDGLEAIPLDAFFDRYYAPGLLESVLANEVVAAPSPLKALRPTPKVTFVEPLPPKSTPAETVEITVNAVDRGGGVGEIRLYQNGKVTSDDTRGVKRRDAGTNRSFTVSLVSGRNELRAVATNSESTESDPALLVIEREAPAPGATLWLLVVGIDKYLNSKYELAYARLDAKGFRDSLVGGGKSIYKDVKEELLFDRDAVKESFARAFARIQAAARPEDVFVFYFAGHGVMSEGTTETPSRFYLVPPDVTKLYGDDAQLEAKAISIDQLRAWVSEVKAQKQLVVLDACQSGGAVERFAMRGAAEEKAILQLARSAGVVVLASTGTEQLASEVKELGHGLFTYALLEGLKGRADGSPRDGKITVKEIEAYLNDAVPELTKKYRGAPQWPSGYARGQDFPIGTR